MGKNQFQGLTYAVTYKRPGYRGRVAYHKLFHTRDQAKKLAERIPKLKIGKNPRVKKVT